MIRILPIEPGAVQELSKEVARESYRLHRIEEPSRWEGSATQALKLQGTVKPDQLAHLLRGYSPDGWVKLADRSQRTESGWGIQFDSPATFNNLWAVSSGGSLRKMQKIQRESVRVALESILEDMSTKGGAIAAVFLRVATRNGRPSLSVAAVIPNLNINLGRETVQADGQTLFPAVEKAEAVYAERLCQGLQVHLGLPVRRSNRTIEIVGVPDNVFAKFDGNFPCDKGGLIADAVRKEKLFEAWKNHASREGWSEKHAQKFFSYHRSHQSIARRFGFTHTMTNEKTTTQSHSR